MKKIIQSRKVSIIVLIIIVFVVGGWYFYKKNISVSDSIKSGPLVSNKPIIGEVGGGGVDIPTTNDFMVTNPLKGEVWNKGDSSRLIKWVYPTELKGKDVHLAVYLVNTTLISQGKDSSEATLDVYKGLIKVPNSGIGEIAWSVLKPLPETAFYEYSGNSKIVLVINDSTSLKNYGAASDNFIVYSSITNSASTIPIEIDSPSINSEVKLGTDINIKWTGFTHQSDICEISLAGPLDQSGEIIQSMGVIVPLGSHLCSAGTFVGKTNSTYLRGGYKYNLIIKTPYKSYFRTFLLSQ